MFKELIELLLIMIITLVIVLVPIFFIVNIHTGNQCRNNVTEMGLNYRYDYIGGCRIEVKPGVYVYWKMIDLESVIDLDLK